MAVAHEIGKFGDGLNLGLMAALGGGQHGGCIHLVAVGTGEQFGHLQEDGGTLVPGHGSPLLLGFQGGVDGLLHMRFVALVVIS